jgi:ketosteroid isomerase-like protein/quercetin dioxygenase-like cupin family protein
MNVRLALSLAALLLGGKLAAQSAPTPVLPGEFKWTTPPNLPALRSTWIVGAERETGSYAQRVILAAGGRIFPHTHPDTRYSTVLSGTLYVGFGTQEDPASMVAVPRGAVYVVKANQPHYLWAKNGEVIYQESGIGPTAMVPVGNASTPAAAPPAAATPAAATPMAAVRDQVMLTEQAFAKTMAARDFPTFSSFISEEAIFFGGSAPLRGKAQVVAAWQPYFTETNAPFSWGPDQVEVLNSGTLAISSGPVFDAQGKVTARFTSIWRQESPGVWRIIFDKGNAVCSTTCK